MRRDIYNNSKFICGIKMVKSVSQIVYLFCIVLFFGVGVTSCKKLVEIQDPINTITTPALFNSEANAVSAITGIYSDMSYASNNMRFANGGITIVAGLSADELHVFNTNSTDYQFETNTILITNGTPEQYFWVPMYSAIYKANAAIEGIAASSKLSNSIKKQLTGEAKFLRAYCYFYLNNLFGDIPLITNTSWANTALMPRTSSEQVVQQIISDLTDAQGLLISDYSLFNKERIRANKWAATSLLARVYLYNKNWVKAEELATSVINNRSLYTLTGLENVFLKNNTEAIWQLQVINQSPWATWEGNQFIPSVSNGSPNYYLTNQLLTAFEAGDQRKDLWTKATTFSGTTYYYPYKYKSRQGSTGNIPEYYTLLRLAEQFLIRAEARAQRNLDLVGAKADLDTLRSRAKLQPLGSALTQSEILVAIAQERRIELFAEWGHRWLDLKRTEQADVVFDSIKPGWQSTAKLYPIPSSELQVNHNLVQNPGY